MAPDESASKRLPGNADTITEWERSLFAHGPTSSDPFYTVPSEAADAKPGALIKVEADTDTSLYSLPPMTALSRFLYQSENLQAKPVPASACILWPYQARHSSIKGPDGADKYRVVVWAHGTTGMLADSAPSNYRNLDAHWQAPFPLVLQGYVVVVVDYAGLGVDQDARGGHIEHQYMANPAGANDIVFAVQAARKAFEKLSKEFVVIGHSQGGGTAWAVAQRQVQHPVEGYLGAVAVSPVTNIIDLPKDSNPVIPLLAAFAAPTIEKLYSEFEPKTLFTPEGWERLSLVWKETSGNVFVLIDLLTQFEVVDDNWRKNPYIKKFVDIVCNGGKAVDAPLLIIQGEQDPNMNAQTALRAAKQTAEKYPASQIKFVLLPGVTHGPAMYASQQIWMGWISDRFDGIDVKRGLEVETVPGPPRPLASYQTEENWTLRVVDAPYKTM